MGSAFQTLEKRGSEKWVRDVYAVINRTVPAGFVADSDAKEAAHSLSDIKEIKKIMYDAVRAARVADGQSMTTLTEWLQNQRASAMSVVRRKNIVDAQGNRIRSGFARDGFWNPMSGIGSTDDPGMYNAAYVPVSMSPQEATAYYSSGGIPAVITDKKAKGALLNGYVFEGNGWMPDELTKLHDYAEKIGFGRALADSLRDGLIFGGAVMYPRLKQDNVVSMMFSVDALLKEGFITKNCIEHFVTTDRWNTVIVPNWNVTARDYLKPDYYYIPIGGVQVATDRSAIVRPKMLPYWGMLPQIGWGISDFEGYIPSVLAYQIVLMSIPIMAQQMSLLFHEIELDGAIAQNGIDAIDGLLRHNDEAMMAWSIIKPISLNAFGKVSTVERHYEGFDSLVNALKVDIGARSGIPESVIFPSTPTGLASDRGEDVMLKQAESVKTISNDAGPQYQNPARIVALSCFGPEYFSGEVGEEKLSTLQVSLNPPIVQTSGQKADAGGKFADFISKMNDAQWPVDVVLDLAKQFFPDVEIDEKMISRLTAIPETAKAVDYEQALSAGGLAEQLAGVDPHIGGALKEAMEQGVMPEQLAEFIGNGGSNGKG